MARRNNSTFCQFSNCLPGHWGAGIPRQGPGVVRRTCRTWPGLPALPLAAAFDGFGAAAFALAFDVGGAGFVVVDIAGFDIDALFAFVEMQMRPTDADEECLDLTLVLFLGHDVEGEVCEFARLRFFARVESFEHIAAADVAGEAHGIVCDIDTIDPGSALLDELLDGLQSLERNLLSHPTEQGFDFARAPARRNEPAVFDDPAGTIFPDLSRFLFAGGLFVRFLGHRDRIWTKTANQLSCKASIVQRQG